MFSFINHYIFPGGYLPSITQLIDHISKESEGTLVVEKVDNIGGHYAKTLRLWRESFMNNFESKIKPALLEKHGDMTDEGVAVFRRKWEVSLTLEGYPLIPADEEISIISDIAKPASSPRPWGMSSFLLEETVRWS